ncbi:pyruvate kinase [Lachnospiraceae bacterium]|nr:pyruvate kinase [Lachnospiraceae bacterium]
MTDIFGTLGPACADEKILSKMFAEGMTGIRINLSHVMLEDCAEDIQRIQRAALDNGVSPKILIDMRGPEIRIGNLKEPMVLREGDRITVGCEGIPVTETAVKELECNDEILLDDGKILAVVQAVQNGSALLLVKRGGTLQSRKSFYIVGKEPDTPAVTDEDLENIRIASEYGVTGVMQPFVRSVSDLETLRGALNENGGRDIKIYAKIENMTGVNHLTGFFDAADEIVIARGDLGNAMPLWELPKVQKQISEKCNEHGIPFMVVTQMLASMEHSKVPTRAEVSDIYNAVLDGASSVMVTGETAVGENPVEVIRYLSRTAAQVNRNVFKR